MIQQRLNTAQLEVTFDKSKSIKSVNNSLNHTVNDRILPLKYKSLFLRQPLIKSLYLFKEQRNNVYLLVLFFLWHFFLSSILQYLASTELTLVVSFGPISSYSFSILTKAFFACLSFTVPDRFRKTRWHLVIELYTEIISGSNWKFRPTAKEISWSTCKNYRLHYINRDFFSFCKNAAIEKVSKSINQISLWKK